MRYVVIEQGIQGDSREDRFVIFGPFKKKELAYEFANQRIATLAGEWYFRDDNIAPNLVTEQLKWIVQETIKINHD